MAVCRLPPDSWRRFTRGFLLMVQRQPLRFFTVWWLVGMAMWVFIIYSSLTPHPVTFSEFKFSDKVLHFTGYFVVTAWFSQLYLRSNFRSKQLLGFVLLGILLEFSQLLVNERSFEWADMLANCSGVLIAGLIMRSKLEALLLSSEHFLFPRS